MAPQPAALALGGVPWRPLLVLAFAMSSDAGAARVQETLAGTQPVGPAGTLTSTGIRVELLRLAGDLARRYAADGRGIRELRRRRTSRPRVTRIAAASQRRGVPASRTGSATANPHNEYLMQLIGGGVISLAAVPGLAGLHVAPGRARARAGERHAGRRSPWPSRWAACSTPCCWTSSRGTSTWRLLAWLLAENRYGAQSDGSTPGCRAHPGDRDAADRRRAAHHPA